MDYLYGEATVSSPVSGVVLSDQYVATCHHATLRIFDHRFNLITEKYLYEKILAIKKLGKEHLIVLFRRNRAAQMTYELETTVLRTVEGISMDVHAIAGGSEADEKNLAVVWDRTKATIFSALSEEHQIVRFSELEIRNVEQVIFLRNYIPTLLVLWRTASAMRCALLALDGVEIIESFAVIDGVIGMHSHGRFIVFLSRHFIQIRFKREVSTLELGGIAAPRDTSVIYRAAEEPLGSIALEGPQLVFGEDAILLINGDGCVYRIKLRCDAARITHAEIVRDGRTTTPSCIDTHNGMCAIGSVGAMSLLCTFGHAGEPPALVQGHAGAGSLPTTASMAIAGVQGNVGCITGMHAKENGDYVFTTTFKTLLASSAIHFQALEK